MARSKSRVSPSKGELLTVCRLAGPARGVTNPAEAGGSSQALVKCVRCGQERCADSPSHLVSLRRTQGSVPSTPHRPRGAGSSFSVVLRERPAPLRSRSTAFKSSQTSAVRWLSLETRVRAQCRVLVRSFLFCNAKGERSLISGACSGWPLLAATASLAPPALCWPPEFTVTCSQAAKRLWQKERCLISWV